MIIREKKTEVVLTSVNNLSSQEKSLGIYIDLRKILQLSKINHGKYFVKTAKMPEKNAFKNCLKKPVRPNERHEGWLSKCAL